MGFKLGTREFKHGIMLAPMAGYSDRAMRLVCKKFGAEVSVTEMVSAKAVTFGDKKTFDLCRIGKDEGAVLLQIFGSDPLVLAEAAGILSTKPVGEASPVSIDINMGCPVNKIFKNGEGSALMRSPEKIFDIVKSTVKYSSLPVTVKMRLGIDREHINVRECALAAEEGGASMICVHGRTRVDMYSGNADIREIRNVKEVLHIPVVANGDITTGEGAFFVLEYTGADGIAVGRGAVGNPFVFAEIREAMYDRKYTPPTLEQKVDTALYQLRLAIEDKGERVAVTEARKQIAAYFKGAKGSAALRGRINSALTFSEVEKILFECLS